MISAKLALKSGEIFEGQLPQGQQGEFFGEVVFNTSMVGYPEAMTDPSYRGQILVFTYPLIGNYGVPDPDTWESDRIQVAGIVVSEAAEHFTHRLGKKSITAWCVENNIPIMSGVDTRTLAKTLSHHGVVPGVITTKNIFPSTFVDINSENLVAAVSIDAPVTTGKGDKCIIAIDCGMKNNIARYLDTFPLRVKRVPYNYDFTDEPFDAVFISNGPGDPAMCDETITILQKAMQTKKPMFGICLGAQLMARAIGASTYKLPFGHRAQNHPCLDETTQRCYLTSQNHGFAIDEKTLPADWTVRFRNLNDNTVQGIWHNNLPFFAVQFHPEHAPGPVDTTWLFDEFYNTICEHTT